MNRLAITWHAWQTAVAHLRACWPDEGVGFFLGEAASSADRFLPARNAWGGRRFLVDPYDQFQTFRLAQTQNKRVVALCHSHPSGGTALSTEDRANAEGWPFLQVVVALASRGAEARAVAWRCSRGEVFPVRLVVEDEHAR